MKHFICNKSWSILLHCLFVVAITFYSPLSHQLISSAPVQKVYAASKIQHVFIIMMENHNWSQIKGNSQAPYINKTLLPMGGHAEQYYNPPGVHPSAPNYVWLEAGAAVTGQGDCAPSSSNCTSSTNHLSKLLDTAKISWKEYAEDATGTSCILDFSNVDVNHVPFSYFNDVTNNGKANSANCIVHERPYTEFTSDLQSNKIPQYSFITPNVNNNMHNGTIQQGDAWLSREVPKIINSQAYKSNGLLLITWDEGEGGDGPIGMIVISPFAKKNYSNKIHYDHSSTLKTLEEIFGVSPMLGGAAKATDLSDFFVGGLSGSSGTGGTGGSNPQPSPSGITPTLFCLGSCQNNPSPSGATGGSGNSPSSAPSISGIPNLISGQSPCGNQKGDTDSDKDSGHKKHHHSKGGISNLMLQLLQILIQIINQLLGGKTNISLPSSLTNPCSGTSPSPSAIPSPSSSPSILPNMSISPSISQGSGSSLGPTTSLHYTANSNWSGNAYTPAASGFNLADIGSLTDVNNLPTGVKGLVYLNLCNGADTNFISTIQPYIGKTGIFGFYLIDEPDPTGRYKTLCSAANLKAESDWVHKNDPGAKTFIIVMNMSASKTPSYMNTYNPANSDIDLYGIDAYPCRTDYNGCDFSIINRNIIAAETSGIPQMDIVPVYQTFGGGSWKTDGGGSYIMPSASEVTQLLNTWASVIPNPVFDYAYSWGSQNGDQALSGSPGLQQIFKIHNK